MNTIGRPLLCLAALGLLILAGCGSRDERVSEELPKQIHKIEPGAGLRIRNPIGAISIHGSDRTDLEMQATKKGRSTAQLDETIVNVASQKDSFTITTNSVREKNKALSMATGSVYYNLLVPRTQKIARVDVDDGNVTIEGMHGEYSRANVVDGKLAVQNCCGNIEVFVANGAIELSFAECRQPSSVDAQLTNGNARILVPRDGSFHVRAETSVGKIINGFGTTVELNGQTSRKVNLSLGKGVRSEINLRVTTGDITIAEAGPETGGTTGSAGH